MRPLRVFIIQAFREPQSEWFRNLVVAACEASAGEFVAVRADQGTVEGTPRLQDRIDAYLKKADICVADMTRGQGGARNENVLLEVGAAYTLRVPVVPVTSEELPSDIRGNLRVPLAVADLRVVEGKVNSDAGEVIAARLKPELLKRLREAKYERGRNIGNQFVAHGFRDRGAVDFYSLIVRSEERIRILTTNLNYIVREKLPCGPARQERTFIQLLFDALPAKNRGFRLEMLALDPDSNYTNERAVALMRNRREFRERMFDDLGTFREFVESEDCRCDAQVKLYDRYPLQMTFFFDDIVVSSVVAEGTSSRYCVTYMHSLDERGARETYEQHFSNVWGAARHYCSSTSRAATDAQEMPWR